MYRRKAAITRFVVHLISIYLATVTPQDGFMTLFPVGLALMAIIHVLLLAGCMLNDDRCIMIVMGDAVTPLGQLMTELGWLVVIPIVSLLIAGLLSIIMQPMVLTVVILAAGCGLLLYSQMPKFKLKK